MNEVFGSKNHPDPMRAHGAWIFLFASVASGAIVGAEHGVEPPLLAGTGFVGAFLVGSSISVGPRRKLRQLLLGTGLAAVAPLAALWLGAEPVFITVAVFATVPAVAAIILARSLGFLSPAALVTGIAALALAAPVVALAGDASVVRAALLFCLLWPFFCWRTLATAASLAAGSAWNRQALRERGLREAAIAATWTAAVTISLRVF